MTYFVVLKASECPQDTLGQVLDCLPYENPEARRSLDGTQMLVSYEDTMPDELVSYFKALGQTPAPMTLKEALALTAGPDWQREPATSKAVGMRLAFLGPVPKSKLIPILIAVTVVAAVVAAKLCGLF